MTEFKTSELLAAGQRVGYLVPCLTELSDLSTVWIAGMPEGGVMLHKGEQGVSYYELKYTELPTEYDIAITDHVNYYWRPTNYLLSGVGATSTLVVVPVGSSDADRGEKLLAAYALCKELTPNDAALSASNRVLILLPVGGYLLMEPLVLDTDFIDLIAQVPGDGALPPTGEYDGVYVATYNPPPTHVYSNADITVVTQTCNDIFMAGFGIGLTKTNATAGKHGMCINATDNTASRYDRMYFANLSTDYDVLSVTYSGGNAPIIGQGSLSGTWTNCRAGISSWRCEGAFKARMYDCYAGPQSYIGDVGTGAVGAYFKNCHSYGMYFDETMSFGGCSDFGPPADAATIFEDCTSEGGKSFFISAVCAASFYRCRSGYQSFSSGYSGNNGGANFSGYAEDCIAGADSFGIDPLGTTNGKTTGTLVRCQLIGNTRPMRAEGVKIYNSRITVTTTNRNAFTIITNGNSRIYNTDIVVVQGGTGVPFAAESALNVRVAHCRMNNAATDADGMGANITNLIGTPYNVIDDDIT